MISATSDLWHGQRCDAHLKAMLLHGQKAFAQHGNSDRLGHVQFLGHQVVDKALSDLQNRHFSWTLPLVQQFRNMAEASPEGDGNARAHRQISGDTVCERERRIKKVTVNQIDDFAVI